MIRVALATSSSYPTLTAPDRRLLPLLKAHGIDAVTAIWDSPTIKWHDFDSVIIRSCWDYHLRPDEFRIWLDMLENEEVTLWNRSNMVRWNMDKSYLQDLADRGIRIVPTIWVQRGQSVDLINTLTTQGWQSAVVKPNIGASGHRTWTVTIADAHTRQPDLDEMVEEVDLMIQPYMPQIAEGEWSLVFFGGNFSHGFLKRPAPNQFFVQTEYGGSESTQPPPPQLIEQAAHILDTAHAITNSISLYARIDGVVDKGNLVLMELELIEPALFTADSPPDTFNRFVAVIQTQI